MHPRLRSHWDAGRSWPVLVWKSEVPVRTIASAPFGGGLGLRRWVVNAQVASSYGRCDPEQHLLEITAAHGLSGSGVGMMTAAGVRSVRYADDGGVEVAATVGLGTPTWAAAPDDIGMAAPAPSTINLVAFIPQRLTDAALVNAVATATEAKTQALWESAVAATGTATDAVCIACPADGAAASFGGPRSLWGARLARALHGAVTAGARAWLAR